MSHPSFGAGIQQGIVYWISAGRLESQRRDKRLTCGSDNDANIGTLISQPAGQFHAFVGCDPAGNTNHNVRASNSAHKGKSNGCGSSGKQGIC